MNTLKSDEVLSQGALFRLESGTRAKPFLKWAGGKSRLLSVLRHHVPVMCQRYFEPFVGGGALFFDLAPSQAVLSDSNAELISCYQVVRDEPDELLRELGQYRVSEEEFYRVRSLRPEEMPRVARAARFIYLNKTCYNGVYRVNKSGQFNTPFGHYKKIALVGEQNLRKASRLLQNASLVHQDYQAILAAASEGDFVYFDPPYMPVSKYGDFKRYTKEFFYERDHERLAQVFAELSKRKCFVLLSNSYHPKIAELYSAFHQTQVAVPRFVNCRGNGRGNVTELLISNYAVEIMASAA
jgi:DNA adenine methylase